MMSIIVVMTLLSIKPILPIPKGKYAKFRSFLLFIIPNQVISILPNYIQHHRNSTRNYYILMTTNIKNKRFTIIKGK